MLLGVFFWFSPLFGLARGLWVFRCADFLGKKNCPNFFSCLILVGNFQALPAGISWIFTIIFCSSSHPFELISQFPTQNSPNPKVLGPSWLGFGPRDFCTDVFFPATKTPMKKPPNLSKSKSLSLQSAVWWLLNYSSKDDHVWPTLNQKIFRGNKICLSPCSISKNVVILYPWTPEPWRMMKNEGFEPLLPPNPTSMPSSRRWHPAAAIGKSYFPPNDLRCTLHEIRRQRP